MATKPTVFTVPAGAPDYERLSSRKLLTVTASETGFGRVEQSEHNQQGALIAEVTADIGPGETRHFGPFDRAKSFKFTCEHGSLSYFSEQHLAPAAA